MKSAGPPALCLVVVPLIGAAGWYSLRPNSHPSPPVVSPQKSHLETLHRRCLQLIPSGDFAQATAVCEQGHRASLDARDYELAARFQMNLGGIQFHQRRFQDALATYREAHALAVAHGARNVAALLTANLASLYSQLGELDAAADWLEASIQSLAGKDRQVHLVKIQLQLAAIYGHQDNLEQALPLYRSVLAQLDAAGDWALYATAWNLLGGSYLRRNDLAAAEPALLESWRVRKLMHLPLGSSYFHLALLAQAQGRQQEAANLLDCAVASARQPGGMLPTWDMYLTRGRLRLEQGQLQAAQADLQTALGLARAWRWAAPVDEASRVGTEGTLQKVYAALIDAGNLSYARLRDPRILSAAADVAEENRASSLRDLIQDTSHFRMRLPAEYWQAMGRLQRAELASIREGAAPAELDALRAELVRMEAGLGPEMEPPEKDVLAHTQAALDGRTTVLAFHLGEVRSWLWAVDREGAAVYELPAADRITAAVDAFTEAVRSGDERWREPARQAHQILFGKLAPRFRTRPEWLVVPDARLFAAPLSALVENHLGGERVLAEAHSIQIVPNLSAVIHAARRRADPDGPFLGVGDAVYNAADPRYRSGLGLLNLPRLVASYPEIETGARVWDREAILLTGAGASRASLVAALTRTPAVVHIAAHVLPSSRRPTYGMIVLSAGEQGQPDLLTPYEIARWRVRTDLVVLSGCASGAGPALPGAGLLGLTRAWLAAGASNVLASRWPVTDDSVELFAAFYRHLRTGGGGDPASALQKARKEILQMGGHAAHPRNWSAYFVVGMPARKSV